MCYQESYEITQNVDFQEEYLGNGCTTLKILQHQEDIKRVSNWLVVHLKRNLFGEN